MRILQEFLLTHDGIDVEKNFIGIDSLKGFHIVYRVRRNEQAAACGHGVVLLVGEKRAVSAFEQNELHLGADDVAQVFVILLRPVCEVFDIKAEFREKRGKRIVLCFIRRKTRIRLHLNASGYDMHKKEMMRLCEFLLK